MSITATCPRCRNPYTLPDVLGGKRIRCKNCDTTFFAPERFGPGAGHLAGLVVMEDEPVLLDLDEAIQAPRRVPTTAILPPRPRRRPAGDRRPLPIPWIVGGVAGVLLILCGIAITAVLLQHGSPSTGARAQAGGDGLRAADGQASVSLETLDRIKSATVFIKLRAGTMEATGSGFVMRVKGDTGYVVTNHHVISPTPDEPDARDQPRVPRADWPLMPRSPRFIRPRFGMHPFPRPPLIPFPEMPQLPTPPGFNPQVQPAAPAGPADVTIVFRSGTAKESSVRAQVIASDADRDLAILKVQGVQGLPMPIDTDAGPNPVETMPVLVFGFPFGEALSLNKGNPAITVTKGSVSSIRLNDQGELGKVQIDGDLNPGNSGGPVVDERGRLVGVAVAKVRGTHIGLAIPAAVLKKLLAAQPVD
ncbi:MAG TPA: trypsin-like peptidase domain-containing protein [Gemmataceae bacterium]|nr:trypsin-like peptidase domain-containing protein [Gemmataceae bacterium]